MSGNHVSADVGGNLNIQSVQDTTVSAAHQSSTSGGFSISQAGGSASFSAQHGSANGDYAAVNEQAGIQAGSGGFDIDVKGNTNLAGAYIGSDADASKNSLTTGTLTLSDIQDHSEYSASSSGFGAGGGIGSTGKATGPGSVSGSGGVTPMLSQSDSGSSSATTKSGIAAGTINITDTANQTQDIASINRDTTDLNGSVSKLPDVNNLLSQQADMMNAAQAAGQTVAQAIGDYASKKQKEAQASADAAAKAGDPDAAAQYKAEADSWAEGGTNRALLHAAGGALIAGLGGGSALGGAAGAGASAVLAGKLNKIADEIGGETGSMLAGNVASKVLAGAGGALLGGNSGAFAAANADLYNRSSTNEKGQGGTESEAIDKARGKVQQYATQFGQAMLDMVPGKQMADQAQVEFATGNYGMGTLLAIGSLGDAALGVLSGGESKVVKSAIENAVDGAISKTVAGTSSTSVQLSQKGLDLVANHLSQFGDDAANAGMLQRLQDAFAASRSVSGVDANFYLHEVSEATMMGRGISYDVAHNATLAKYGVSPFELYAPQIIEANPTLFNNAWRAAAGLKPLP